MSFFHLAIDMGAKKIIFVLFLNMNVYLHFTSFFITEMPHVVDIHNQER